MTPVQGGSPVLGAASTSSTGAAAAAVAAAAMGNGARDSRSSSPFGNFAGGSSGGGANGGAPISAAARAERFKGGDDSKIRERFRTLRMEREAKRQRLIESGVMANPEKAQGLDDARKFQGTCREMCPEFERVEREMDKELDPLERIAGTMQCDPRRAVKKYRRAAAGKEASLPEDIRPPEVLASTLDYLLHELLPASPYDAAYNAIQAFLWDRTRALRQDFTVQSNAGATAIECHERIARYHIFTLHFRGGLVQLDGSIVETPLNPDGTQAENLWSEQQELEQLRKSECRRVLIPPEFR